MGLAAALLGDTDRASSVLTEGVTAHPHAAVLLNNLAAVLERESEYETARSMAERGVLEDPAVSQLHKNLGDLHYREARYDDALEAYLRWERALALDPDNAIVRTTLESVRQVF